MNLFVLDASVIIKWLIPENPDEQNVAEALALLYALRAGTIAVWQPCHWLAEIAAVGVRLKPDTITDDIADLQELGMVSVTNIQPLWNIACSLSIRLNHHLFDTLYHAVALHLGALLITADEQYFRKAKDIGNIKLLADYRPI
jgi:predicted nucleic acid-binding protein